ncbi:MAG: hypothetical protein LBD30_04870, partial [Verrucomicrobiales bacterium]|nr:hypothetical protein [Verrucomicrobiales bacterium]
MRASRMHARRRICSTSAAVIGMAPACDKSMHSAIEIAIVGLARGQAIINELEVNPRHGCKVAAVCDADDGLSIALGNRLNARTYSTLGQVLADPAPVVGLFTGAAGRAALLRQIIRAGKDVMTTQPCEIDAA